VSARAFWIVALGAALAVLVGLNLFRAQEQAGVGADAASPPFRAGVEAPAAQPPATAVRASPSVDQRVDATGADGRGAPAEPQPVPALFPTSGRYASMSTALADHDVPPERRMQVLPELLETDRAFAAESVDPVWATATEAGVLGRIAQIPGVAYVSLNVECRTTLCLLQFVQATAPTPNSSIGEIAKLVEPQGLKALYMFGIRVREGVPLGIAYLQRVEPTEAPAAATERSVQ